MYKCPMTTFFYTNEPYYTPWLSAQRYPSTIYPINPVSTGAELNYICPGYAYYRQRNCHAPTKISKAEVDLMNNMRMLWEQHIAWTRMTIISIIRDSPDVDFVIERLLRNPMDFQVALRSFYGDKIASKFSDLLKSHLVIAAELVKAAKAGDNTTAADAEKRWYANADEIAAFLASINPYWSEESWRTMLYKHLALTKSEAVDMLTKNYDPGITVYDEIEKQALEMADAITKGIVKQFPDKFAQ